MDSIINHWHDWWRIGILLVGVASLGILAYKFYRCRDGWGEQERDAWFMMTMWALATTEMQIEGLLRDTPLRYRLVFISAAIILTLRLLTKRYRSPKDAEA